MRIIRKLSWCKDFHGAKSMNEFKAIILLKGEERQ